MPPEQEQLRCLLRARLYQLLAEVPAATLPRCRRVRVLTGPRAAVLLIGPAAEVLAAQAADAARVGQWFSPLESGIVMACTAAPLQGKEIAAAIGRTLDAPLWAILKNLVDRGVLEKVSGEGYQVVRPA
jgi:hypothetical protein